MPKRDYRQFCPTARALNVVGERWTLLIVRDLLLGPRRYSELRRSLPGMASNLLAVRLAEMEEAELIRKHHQTDPSPRDVYVLTERGAELESVLLELARFGFPFLGMPTDDEPMLAERVPLGLRAMMHDAEFPDDTLTIRFDLDEGDHLVTIEAPGPRGARRAPAERVRVEPVADGTCPASDVTVSGSMVGLLWIRQGISTLAEMLASGTLRVRGEADSMESVRHLYRLDPAIN